MIRRGSVYLSQDLDNIVMILSRGDDVQPWSTNTGLSLERLQYRSLRFEPEYRHVVDIPANFNDGVTVEEDLMCYWSCDHVRTMPDTNSSESYTYVWVPVTNTTNIIVSGGGGVRGTSGMNTSRLPSK